MSGAAQGEGEPGPSPGTSTRPSPSPRAARSYDDLLASAKTSLNARAHDHDETNAAEMFQAALDEAHLCIAQGFITISDVLEDGNTTSLVFYLENSVAVLQLLSKYIEDTLEIAAMTCALFHSFPTVSANIIRNVYVHCKDSESLYGNYLSIVEKQLKDLFRSCHELQLVYLMIMEKHFIFDCEDQTELGVLYEALNTNIEIGQLVIHLDVKTMAEQWKGFSALCEKYSKHLTDKHISGRCIDVVSAVALDNIRSCVVDEQDDKVLLRSLKVTSFLMKIVIKVCQIFKSHVTDDFKGIVLLLVTIKANSEAYLRTLNKPEQFIQQVKSHVTIGAEPIISELMDDETFAASIMAYNCSDPQHIGTLGYLLLMMSIISAVLQKDDPSCRVVWLGHSYGENIVCRVLRILNKSHYWLASGLKFECWASKTSPAGVYGLYEHLLTHAGALAATADVGQFNVIEEGLARGVAGGGWEAMFAADLWVILARYSTTNLCVDQIKSLINALKELKQSESASRSAQFLQISNVIRRLYNTLPISDKLIIFYKYSINDTDNVPVWAAIGVKNLPEKQARDVSNVVFDKLGMDLKNLLAGKCDIYKLMDSLRLASTCYTESVPTERILQAWLKCYINTEMLIFLTEDESSVQGRCWFTQFVVAMTELTVVLIKYSAFDNKQLIQILNVTSSIIAKSSSALKFCSISILTSLSFHKIPEEPDTEALCTLITNQFRKLLTDPERVVKTKGLVAFKIFALHTSHENIIPCVVANDKEIKETVINFIKTGEIDNETSWLEEFKNTHLINVVHKCNVIENTAEESEDYGDGKTENDVEVMEVTESKESLDNFDMDIDNLFENSDFEESQSKKMKLNSDEIESVISRIENNVLLLNNMKKNVTQVERIRKICKLLDNIVS